MRLENPVQLGGLAALLAGVLLLISQLFDLYLSYLDPGAVLSILPIDSWLGLLLVVLIQLGLAGLYAPQAKAMGLLGAVGLFMAFIGAWLTMGSSFISPMAKQSAWPVGEPEEFWGPLALFGLTFVLGWVLFGVAALRAGVYPRSAAALLIAGALILLLPLPLTNVIFAVAVAWMGYILFTGRGREAARPTHA